MKAYVHIGMDKTGTTYLQQLMTDHHALLRERGLQYPVRDPSGGEFSHVHFARALGFGWNDDADAHSVETAARHLEPVAGDKTLLLSAEAFSTSGDPALVQRLRSQLAAWGYDEVKVIVFLRNQIDYFVSLYSEAIKWGAKEDVSAFYDVARGRLFYVHLLDGWASVFGQENIVAVNYDASYATLSDVFFSLLGLDAGVKETFRNHRVDFANRSPPQILMEGVRLCVVGIPRDALYEVIVKTIARRQGADLAGLDRLSVWPLPARLKSDADEFDEHNRNLAARYGFDALATTREAIEKYDAGFVACDAVSINFLSMLMFANLGAP